MKKLWLCILTVLCLCGATAFAACGIIKDVEDTPELPATYTVTVAVSDEGYGTVSRSSVTGIAKDTAVTVNGATLTIGETAITATPTAATAQYTYAFTGFTGTVDAVTENITVTANFSRTTNVYTVIWADEDGTAIDTDTNVAYGTVPTFDGTNPTKIATAQYTYTFAGWTPTVAAITGDTTYTATFTPVTREYDVIFQNEDGTELQNTKVAYGTTPAYNGETPEKTATADYIYEFNGWDGEIADVAGDATYTATYISLLILKTADDFVSNFNTEFYDDTANGGSMYAYHSFALNNDIDMAGKIVNSGDFDMYQYNAYTGIIDGRGHVVENLTLNPDQYASYGGLIEYKAAYGAVVKDIALVNMTTPRAFITNIADGLVLKNVYISGTSGWGEVFDEAHDTYGKVVVENVIINSSAELYDTQWSDNIIINNVINISKIGGVAEFFTTYAEGLGDEWANSGFVVENEKLTFHGTVILEKNPAIAIANESDLNSKYLKHSDESYVFTSDINCTTGTSISYYSTSGKTGTAFTGTLNGNGHVIKNPVIDDDIYGYGMLGVTPNGATVKDIAVVNLTNSSRNYLSYYANDVTVENSYFSGTCGWHDLFEEVTGTVTLKNVILDCYCSKDGYALGKAGTSGAANVVYDNVITLDKNDKGAHSDSEYGGTLMTYEEFFTTYADGLGDEWADSGFAITAEGLTYNGTLVVERPAA